MNAVIITCIVLFALGAVAAVRWGHLSFTPPWSGEDVSFLERLRRGLWFLDVMLLAALFTGLLVIGPGGRLVMRLLAVTAGDDAQGRVTEAQEIVGEITVGGTIGFVLFVGILGGVALAVLYAVLRKWLPAGRGGALLLGAIFGIMVATRIDPLRPDNRDFDIVGPDWLSVVAFVGLGAIAVLTFTAAAARLARIVPLVSRKPTTLVPYAALILLVPLTFLSVAAVVGGVVAAALLSRPDFRRFWSDRRVLLAGRVVIALVALAFLPGFVRDVAEIL